MKESPKRRKVWFLPALALLLLVGAGLTFRLLFPPFSPPVLPVPNGYDDLQRAAKLLAPRTGFYFEMDKEELATIVEQNAPALDLAREGLQKECMVTIDWTPGEKGFESSLDLCQSMREIARAMAAAARQAKAEGKTEAAVGFGFDSLELAQATARGGLLIDRMVSAPVYYLGLISLRNQIDDLSQQDCQRLRKKLESSPLQLEPIDEVIRRDMAFNRQAHGIYVSFMMRRAVQDEAQKAKERMRVVDQRVEAHRTLLQTHLALREFKLNEGQLPAELSELVPDYLTEVPQDPFASAPLVYRRQADSYQLYSVGSNKVDDNGVESQSGKQADLLLEPSD